MGSGIPYGSIVAATEIGPGTDSDLDLKFSVSGPGNLAARILDAPLGRGDVPKGDCEGEDPKAEELAVALSMAL
jgi:hypothetical protein